MKLRIDFSVRETDVPPEDARGVRFGDDIDSRQVFDFFNKCRDAVMTLFGQKVPKDAFDGERQQLQAEIDRLKTEVKRKELERLVPARGGDPGIDRRRETAPWEYRPDKKHWMTASNPVRIPNMDDGSRGGDGPPSPEFLKALEELNNPDRDRY